MEPVSKGRQGMKRGGLGRGLSALIPGAVEEGAGLLEIPVGAIGPNPRQPRTTFQDESLDALAVSIKEVVRRLVDQPPPEATTARVTPRGEGISLAEVEEILSEQLATRVSIQMGRKRGRIVIEFGSADDLERIVSEIIGSGPGLAPSN